MRIASSGRCATVQAQDVRKGKAERVVTKPGEASLVAGSFRGKLESVFVDFRYLEYLERLRHQQHSAESQSHMTVYS